MKKSHLKKYLSAILRTISITYNEEPELINDLDIEKRHLRAYVNTVKMTMMQLMHMRGEYERSSSQFRQIDGFIDTIRCNIVEELKDPLPIIEMQIIDLFEELQ